MKYYLYGLAVAASLMMLPGCSADDTCSKVAPPPYIPGDSEVEIACASLQAEVDPTVSKRATINSMTDLTEMGVWCLARSKQTGYETAPDIKWFDADESYGSCIMNNVRASVNSSTGALSWENTYFYPICEYYAFEFYGYAPYEPSGTNVVMTSTDAEHSAVVNYTIDGTKDILWGRATDETMASAYSAMYYRGTVGNSRALPTIQLNHMLTRLTFEATAGDELTDAMSIVSISVVNQPNAVKLRVADFENRDANNANMAARMSATGSAEFTLKTSDGAALPVTKVPIDAGTTVSLGDAIMLMPAAQYDLRVVLRKTEASGTATDREAKITLKPVSGTQFVMGKSYKVKIRVNNYEVIQANANVADWVNQDGPVVNI